MRRVQFDAVADIHDAERRSPFRRRQGAEAGRGGRAGGPLRFEAGVDDLPQLAQMPVWFAMYTTLQTAVEMYHEKFLWFADLSVADRFFVLPVILGGLMIVQQRLVPQQGMDPVQQKMMMYMMPALFTFMMLFLPSGLGVYMLTNTWLGIGQQLLVEM